MASIDDDNRMGSQSPFSNTSTVNQGRFQIEQALKQQVQTAYLARIDSCDGQEEKSGSSYVSVTPMTAQTDTEGNALPMVSLPKLPFARYQYGVCAMIIDPVAGDIVPMIVSKHDISNIKQGATEPTPANSQRNFSQSDSIALLPVHTQTPTNFILLRQDGTLYGKSPKGYEWETEENIKETAGKSREISISENKKEDIGQNLTLTIGQDGSITISGMLSINVSGQATIKASNITLDASNTKVTGNLSVAGNISAGDGGGGNGTFNGSVTVKGSVTAQGNVTGGGISLTSHKHGNGNEGHPTTGPM